MSGFDIKMNTFCQTGSHTFHVSQFLLPEITQRLVGTQTQALDGQIQDIFPNTPISFENSISRFPFPFVAFSCLRMSASTVTYPNFEQEDQ